MTSPAQEKKRLRVEARAIRDALDAAWRAEASEVIAQKAIAWVRETGAETVAAYCSYRSEVETQGLLELLTEHPVRLFLPRVSDCRNYLTLHEVNDLAEGLKPGAFGIMEPDPKRYPAAKPSTKIDAAFVPGIAFDRRGIRLGHGKGHYDRLFTEYYVRTKIGLAFSGQIVDAAPSEPHDAAMDRIFTEREILEIPEKA